MGYVKSNDIKQDDLNKINKAINEASLYCILTGVYTRLKIIDKTEDTITMDGGIIIQSSSLCKFLNQSEEIFLMGVTAGKDITDYRDKLIKNEDLFLTVIADAVGSETVEEGANWIHDFLSNSIKKQGLKTTRLRYSPGYGDFSLEFQKNIFNILHLDKLDLTLSENYLISPEKSITAVIGIINNI